MVIQKLRHLGAWPPLAKFDWKSPQMPAGGKYWPPRVLLGLTLANKWPRGAPLPPTPHLPRFGMPPPRGPNQGRGLGLVIGCKSQYEYFPISCTVCCSPHTITIAPTICLILLFQQSRIAKCYYCHMAPNNANFLGFKPKNWLKNDWVWGNLVFN